jgi:hypothetical protein
MLEGALGKPDKKVQTWRQTDLHLTKGSVVMPNLISAGSACCGRLLILASRLATRRSLLSLPATTLVAGCDTLFLYFLLISFVL